MSFLKGTSDGLSKNSEQKKLPSPRDDDVIVLSSQEDNEFRLHLTQSQSNSAPTRVAIRPKMGDDRQCQNESLSATSQSPSQSILPQTSTRRSTIDERNQTQEQHGLEDFTKASNVKETSKSPEKDEDAIAVRPSSSGEVVRFPAENEQNLNEDEDETNELLDEKREGER